MILSSRTRRALLLALCAFGLGLPAGAAPASTGGALPVWLSPSLGGSPSKVAAKLRERFVDAPLLLRKGDDASAGVAKADTCEQLLRLARADYSMADQTTPSLNVFNARVSYCERLELAATARPARQSFLTGYKLTPASVNELPASVEEQVSNDFAQLLQESDATGTSLGSSSRASGTKLRASVDGEWLVLQHAPDDGFELRLAIEGRGDFNGDGVEDLLLAGDWSGGGSMHVSYTRLVTRLAPGQGLRPLEPGKPVVPPTGCSGDEIDRKRNALVKGGRTFTPASVALVDEALARCQPRAPSLQLLWLLNDGAFVAYKLQDLEKCRGYLARADAVKQRVDEVLLPEGLRKALAHNQKLCAAR